MFETANIDNQNLVDINADLTNEAYGLEATANNESASYTEGTLSADIFVLDSSFQVNIFSGNGNIDYGIGVYDTLDLSNISVDEVVDVSFADIDEGGVIFDTGNGEKAFDYLVLDDGTEILFEGIENLVFADNSVDLTVNPNDPNFVAQWNLHTVGLQTAWGFTTGEDNVLIGVQDTGLGFDASGGVHPDLQADDTWILSDNVSDEFLVEVGGANDERDSSHGTAVQGIIAAGSDNGVGIAGINWDSGVYNIDVLQGNDKDLDLADATQQMIDEATASGQKLVINMSLSGGSIDADFEALVANNQDDVLFVIASGNDGADELGNPSSLAIQYDNVIAVGAAWGQIDEAGVPVEIGTIANYSNTGEGLTLVAPTAVLTTQATKEGELNYNAGFNGTSAATPHVAGIASLVWSANGELDATQVKEILSDTAVDLGAEGYDLIYGSGMINADAAVRQAIALGRSTSTTTSGFDAALTSSSVVETSTSTTSNLDANATATETQLTVVTNPNYQVSDTDSSADLIESNQAELPTSLFDYKAAGMEDVVAINGQMMKEDLFSSPLYAA